MQVISHLAHFSISGTLHSVDQYLNIKLTDINVTDPEKYPHMLSVKNCFIRGSVVRLFQNACLNMSIANRVKFLF